MSCRCAELAPEGMPLHPACIGQVWIFADLAPSELQALVEAAERRRFNRGDTVFAQGEPAREMFLIKAGRVKITKITADGQEYTLDLRQAGDFLGENMLSEEADFPVSATCLEDTITCGFTREGFESLVLGQPNIGLQVIRNLSRRIDRLVSRVGDMAGGSIEERLYRVLAGVAREHGLRSSRGYVLQLPLTHEDLGFLVGAHRVSITRAVKELKASGRVLQEGKAWIVRPESLEAF